MQKGIIGKKVGMTQIFDAEGKVIPVTVIEAGPCVVTQKKSVDKDGYDSIQLGFYDTIERKLTKAQVGHLKKAGDALKKYLKEFRLENTEAYNVGDVVKADTFVEGERVDITGVSKGKGFAGTIKRWNASRGRMSHGGGPVHRHAGSMGSCSSPSRIFKGKIMPGHLGTEKVTIQNLDVDMFDAELNVIAVRGDVPGSKGGIDFLKDTVQKA